MPEAWSQEPEARLLEVPSGERARDDVELFADAEGELTAQHRAVGRGGEGERLC